MFAGSIHYEFMSAIQCPNRITCPGTDFPITNYSSEGPEQVPLFRSLVFPESWDKQGCLSLCISDVSQDEADLCALTQAAACNPPTICVGDACYGGDGDDTDGGQDGDDGGNLPNVFFNAIQECSVPCEDGTFYTFTVPAGTFSASTQAAADTRAQTYACDKAKENRICINDLAVNSVCLGDEFNQTVTFLVGTPPAVVLIESGALPPGITLTYTDSDFTLSGFANGTGAHTFMVRVEDLEGHFSTKEFTINVAHIANTSLANGTVSTAYSEILFYSGAVTGNVQWAVTSGALPTGLTLNPSTGVISGTPTTAGSFTFTIGMTDGF